jgi:hypothetical protein
MNHDEPVSHINVISRTSRPLVDKKGRLVGILAGTPSNAKWKEAVERMTKKLKTAQELLGLGAHSEAGDRGDFVAKHCGYTHGGGRTQPSNHEYRSQTVNDALAEVLGDNDFDKLAWFQSGSRFCPIHNLPLITLNQQVFPPGLLISTQSTATMSLN